MFMDTQVSDLLQYLQVFDISSLLKQFDLPNQLGTAYIAVATPWLILINHRPPVPFLTLTHNLAITLFTLARRVGITFAWRARVTRVTLIYLLLGRPILKHQSHCPGQLLKATKKSHILGRFNNETVYESVVGRYRLKEGKDVRSRDFCANSAYLEEIVCSNDTYLSLNGHS